MKKYVRFVIIGLAIAIICAISVAAEVTVNLNAYDEDNSIYMVGVDYKAEGGCLNTLTVKFTYNTEKMILTNTSLEQIADPLNAGNDPVYFPTVTVGSGLAKKEYSFEAPDNSIWVENGTNKVQGYVTGFSINGDKFDNDNGFNVFNIIFTLADSVTPKDITEDDFIIDYVYVADTNLGESGYNVPSISNQVTFTNNVVSAPTVSVKAGDVVYEGNKAPVKVAQTGKYDITIESGYVVVNTGVTAQKVYKVEDGAVSEVEELENAVLSTDISEASVRSDIDSKTGLKFIANFSAAASEVYVEAGFIATAETAIVGNDYELDMALVAEDKAKSEEITEFVSSNINVEVSRAVVTGIPLTKNGVETTIACRPYIKLADGTVIYGEVMKTTLRDVALAIKDAADQTEYKANKVYIDRIISAQDNEVNIPVNPDEV